jgi:soluble lytic murein transglycosylase-like protein
MNGKSSAMGRAVRLALLPVLLALALPPGAEAGDVPVPPVRPSAQPSAPAAEAAPEAPDIPAIALTAPLSAPVPAAPSATLAAAPGGLPAPPVPMLRLGAAEPVRAAAAAPAAPDDDRPVFEAAPLNLDFMMSDTRAAELHLLTDSDSDLYRRVFALQASGDMAGADRLIGQIQNRGLIGHVLYQRYMHPTAWHSTYSQLSSWLTQYADLPGADRVYSLANRRRPSGAAAARSPVTARGISGNVESYGFQRVRHSPPTGRSAAQSSAVDRLERDIRTNLVIGAAASAKALLDARGGAATQLTAVERDALLAEVAEGFFYERRPQEAYDIARQAAARSGRDVPLAHWIAGLAAWRLGHVADAGPHFEAVGQSDRVSPWMQAAGAYWASRVHMSRHQPREVGLWLRRAAVYPHTFYGILATQALGAVPDLNWRMPEVSQAHITVLSRNATGWRALALLQTGERRRAAEELARINPGNDRQLAEALIAVAYAGDMPDVALKLASAVVTPDNYRYDAALYPVPPWQPEGGFAIDRALLYAFMRQESRFRPEAESSSGAAGLMQLLPSTANFIAEDGRDYRRGSREALYRPSLNMTLGQAYLQHLMSQPNINGDLIYLAAAYNGGPGNLSKWQRDLNGIRDPLLFVESIPLSETRDFVERVLTNYWIYRQRLGESVPSLTELAGGRAPVYRQPQAQQASLGR